MNKVKLQDLEKVLEPLFYHWKRRRQSKESFGDFTTRMVSSKATKILLIISWATCGKISWLSQIFVVNLKFLFFWLMAKRLMWNAIVLCQGFEKLQELVDKWEGPVLAPSRFNLKLFADKETYEAVDQLAKLQNKNAHQLAMEVIRNFVASQQNGKGE